MTVRELHKILGEIIEEDPDREVFIYHEDDIFDIADVDRNIADRVDINTGSLHL